MNSIHVSAGLRASLYVWLLALTASAAAGAPEPAGRSSPTFAAATCELPAVGAELSARLTCGTVEVPMDHARPHLGSLRLFVVVARHPRQPVEPDPLVIMHGGPGEASSSHVAFAASALHNLPMAARDVIFVDQRGTGRSEPRECDSAQQPDPLQQMSADLTTEQFVTASSTALRECLELLQQRGLPPDAWGTHVTVEDFELVRKALGIVRWNALSISYGTSVAMDYAARHPAALRSMVLDSVLPPDPLPLDPRVAFFLSRDALFALCAKDPDCRQAYPDLPTNYQRALDRLGDEPLPVPVSEHLGLPGNRLLLNRGDFELMIHQMLYERDTYGLLPGLIQAAAEGRAGQLGPAMEALGSRFGNLSLATFAAVTCRDSPRYHSRSAALFGFDVALAGGWCPDWMSAGPLPQVPAGTKVPTLIVAGSMDPITHPAYGSTVAARIGSAARFIVMRDSGHGPLSRPGRCNDLIVASFLSDPTGPLDAACAQTPEAIIFR